MFLSAQSFANLSGKGLLCTFLNNSKPEAYYFISDRRFNYMSIKLVNDTYSIYYRGEKNYQTDIDFIYLADFAKVNRKTLEFFINPYPKEPWGKCEAYNSNEIEALKEKHNDMRMLLQEKYNKKLEGNKI
jgi:hypothetical protein